MTILRTEALSKRFGDLTAVDSMDFDVRTGEFVGIIGPNGAGKTTFVNLLTGVLPPSEGTIYFDGDAITDRAVHERAKLGLVRSFQIPEICNELTPTENVRSAVLSREGRTNAVFTPLGRETESEDEALSLLDQFGLRERADVAAETIPHGEKKILDVCMSVAMRPKVLILDEPTSGVATTDKHAIMERIVEYFADRESAILFIEHDLELIREYAERVVAMDQGTKLTEGDPEVVLSADTVKRRIRGEN